MGGRGFCLHSERGERGEGSPARALSDITTPPPPPEKKKKHGGGGKVKDRWGRSEVEEGGKSSRKKRKGGKGAPKQEKPGASNYSAIC